MMPITSSEQTIQIGPLVLAKNPTYGDKKAFKYEQGGSVSQLSPQALALARELGLNPNFDEGGDVTEKANEFIDKALEDETPEEKIQKLRKKLDQLSSRKLKTINPMGFVEQQGGMGRYKAGVDIPFGDTTFSGGIGGSKYGKEKLTTSGRHFGVSTPVGRGHLSITGERDPNMRSKAFNLSYNQQFAGGGQPKKMFKIDHNVHKTRADVMKAMQQPLGGDEIKALIARKGVPIVKV